MIAFSKRLAGALALTLAAALPTFASDTPHSVRIGIVSFTQGGKPVFGGVAGRVAQEGWLEQELKKRGVALEWQALPHANAGPQINEGFSNNSLDFAVRGDLPSVIALAAGVPGKLVVPGGSGNNIYLVVPKDSPAQSIEDLKGKRLALHRGRPWEFAFSEFLGSKGLALKDFKIANINPQVGAAAVSAGKVDAAVLLSEAYLLEDKHVGRVLWSSKQGDPDWRLASDLWGTERFVTTEPQLTQLVATAWVKASHWLALEQNADEYYRFSSLEGTPESVLRRDDQGDPVPWQQRWAPKSDVQLLKHFTALAQYALDNQLISEKPDLSQSLDTRFTEQAIIDLGLQNFWPSLKAQLNSAR